MWPRRDRVRHLPDQPRTGGRDRADRLGDLRVRPGLVRLNDQNPILDACVCPEPELQLLRDLLGKTDLDQWSASLIAFGHDLPKTASPLAWSIWAKVEARRLGNNARLRLGMPELPADGRVP